MESMMQFVERNGILVVDQEEAQRLLRLTAEKYRSEASRLAVWMEDKGFITKSNAERVWPHCFPMKRHF